MPNIDIEEIKDIFKAEGTLSLGLNNFEFRLEQYKMALAISASFNEGNISLIEAGTGTGKTFAYLVPAIFYATGNNERVVISTKTINLQEQIIFKDIPLLKKILKIDFKAGLLKGRNNYICLKRLNSLNANMDIFDNEEFKEQFNIISAWIKLSKEGSLSELDFVPLSKLWNKINSDANDCLRSKCQYFKKCFFFKSKRRILNAHIIVVNHHLLFSDLNLYLKQNTSISVDSDSFIIPEFKSLIIDEAHNVEDIATNIFSGEFSEANILKQLNNLCLKKGRKKLGFLADLRKNIKVKSNLNTLLLDAMAEVLNAKKIVEKVFEAINEFINDNFRDKAYIEIKGDFLHSYTYKDNIEDNLYEIYSLCIEISRHLIAIKEHCQCLEVTDEKFDLSMIYLQNFINYFLELKDAINIFITKNVNDIIRWIENNEYGVKFIYAPLEVKHKLVEAVFQRVYNLILTSATLSVNGNLRYIKNRLGLDEDIYNLNEIILPSPFDYLKQVTFEVYKNILPPTDNDYPFVLAENLISVLEDINGKAFVLFTSYNTLNTVFNIVKEKLRHINIFRQGDLPRYDLIEIFKYDISSVLFATDSFWEGVDVEGESLSNVIITRLPFKMPDDPIIKGRIDKIERSGGNAFLDYSLPQAILKFRQGFGRLIRSKTDKGKVIVFDSRIVQKSYGKVFINSVPKCNFILK